MAANLREIVHEGDLKQHAQLLEKYRPSMLELLKIQGLGPKTVNLIWMNFQVSDVAGVEQLAREGKLRTPAAHERKDRAENPEGHSKPTAAFQAASISMKPTARRRN